MKQLIILLVLSTFITFYCFSQSYETIIKPDTSIWYFGNKQMPGTYIDTIFAGRKVGDWTNIYYKGVFYNDELTYAGKVKSNNENSKIWYISPESIDTLLVFDLDLNVGDTIIYPYKYNPVDSIYYKNERKIIEFKISTEFGNKCQFIEGVGPNLSFLLNWARGSENGIGGIVVCKYEKDDHVYTINCPLYFKDCDALNTEIETIDNKIIRVYPNPVKDYLEIEIENTTQEYDVSIIDLNGRVLINKKISGNCSLNTSMLRKGSFLLKLHSEKNCQNVKIVKR